MGYDNWNRAIRNGVVANDIKELLREAGFDPEVKPTHEWLNMNGFSGIQNYARRNDKTVDEVLYDELGFSESQFDYEIDHPQTERLIRRFMTENKDELGVWGESSIPSKRSGIKKIAACSRKVFGSDNLLRPARQSPEVAREMFLKLCAQLEEDVGEGSCNNYANVLNKFYDYLVEIEYIEKNYFEPIYRKKNYQAKREAPKEADIPSAKEVRTLFTNGDDILKTAVLLLAGAGDRPQKVVERTVADLDLDRTDPQIYSGSDNKTGPSANALMAGREFLQNIAELRSRTQDGENVYIFPSNERGNPHLSYRKLLKKVKDHAREHDVTKHDGDPITLKPLKQFYLNEQVDAHLEFQSTVARRATDAVGDQRASVKDGHYIVDQNNRDHLRQYAEAKFAVAFPQQVTTMDEVRNARARRDRKEGQTGLEDFE
jgi:integrase